ncbi:MAG: contractile injection system tape measure protein, partial [Bacteroidota bacterium]
MKRVQHQIRTQRMELAFNSEVSAQALHDAVADLCKTTLGEVVERCLQSYYIPDTSLSIHLLEIDLGTIRFSEIRTELPARLEEALDRELAKLLMTPQAGHVEVRPASSVDLKAFEHFLDHGFLPWTCQRDISELVLESFNTHPTAVAELIRKAGTLPRVRIRLANRFANEMLKRIIRELEPQHADVIISYHGHLLAINYKQAIVKTPQRLLAKTLWLFVLNHLLADQSSVFNARNFAKSLLTQFAAHYNLAYGALLDLITQGLHEWQGTIPEPFLNLLATLRLEHGLQTERASVAAIPWDEIQYDVNNNEESMAASPVVPDAEELRAIPQSWYRQPTRIIAYLRSQRNRREAAQYILKFVEATVREKLVKVLEPAEHHNIIEYAGSLAQLHRQHPMAHVSRHEFEESLWSFVISNLLDDRGSYFNHKSFLKKLIESLSKHFSVQPDFMVARLRTFVATLPTNISTINNLSLLVEDLYIEDRKNAERLNTRSTSIPLNEEQPDNELLTLLASWISQKRAINKKDEITFLTALRSEGSKSQALLLHALQWDNVRERLAGLSASGFSAVLKAMGHPAFVSKVLQWVEMFMRQRQKLQSSFGGRSSFVKALQLAVLKTIGHYKVTGTHQNASMFSVFTESVVSSGVGVSKQQLLKSVLTIAKGSEAELIETVLRPGKRPKQIVHVTPEAGHDALLQWLVVTRTRYPIPPEFGFSSYTEAFRFGCLFYAGTLRTHLRKCTSTQVRAFINRLNEEEIDMLARTDEQYTQRWQYHLLQLWRHRLNGFFKQQELLLTISRILLWSTLSDDAVTFDRVQQALWKTLQSYALPNSFYSHEGSWFLPASGDVTEAIQLIEREMANPVEPSGRSQRKLRLKEQVRNEIKRLQRHQSQKKERGEGDENTAIYISNAGLVLLHPYLAHLFAQCGLLNNHVFNNQEAAQRAIVMLHYACSGQLLFKEEDCVLNKILCGFEPEANLESVHLHHDEKDMVNSMLRALASHWEVMKNSTEDEMRGNWLVR